MNPSAPLPGPVLVDIAGFMPTPEERERLKHPLVGGIILFTRNFESPEQLRALTSELKSLRETPFLISVDHEGGRVQRFRSGFTRLPAMRVLGDIWEQDRAKALETASSVGHVLAAELRAVGVDLSFAPVLDLDYGNSSVIGDRSFHAKPFAVTALAGALIEGMVRAGMSAVGKHFPGHGYVTADSHVDIPRDARSLVEIAGKDLIPFHALNGRLGGVMPAHVIYQQVENKPAGFSRYWLKTVLRGELGFKGAIFSDDLSMAGAKVAGGILERAGAAWDAGCDVLLVCNDPTAAGELLDSWKPALRAESARRLAALIPAVPAPELSSDPDYGAALEQVLALEKS